MSARKRILFVCLGNSIRSQMAEAFARARGTDVIEATSAGLYPAGVIQQHVYTVMDEVQVSLEGQASKSLYDVQLQGLDRIINISGEPLLGPLQRIATDWSVPDPIGRSVGEYRKCRDDISRRVDALIAELRA